MAATRMTNAEWTTWVDNNITTNGVGGITGAVLNEGLKILGLSVLPFTQKEYGSSVSLSTGISNLVTFNTSFPSGATYTLLWRCRDSSGNDVVPTIEESNQTIAGFTVVVSKACNLDYIAIQNP